MRSFIFTPIDVKTLEGFRFNIALIYELDLPFPICQEKPPFRLTTRGFDFAIIRSELNKINRELHLFEPKHETEVPSSRELETVIQSYLDKGPWTGYRFYSDSPLSQSRKKIGNRSKKEND